MIKDAAPEEMLPMTDGEDDQRTGHDPLHSRLLFHNINQTALHYAATRGHSDVMKVLLDSKADVNARGR